MLGDDELTDWDIIAGGSSVGGEVVTRANSAAADDLARAAEAMLATAPATSSPPLAL